MFDTNRCQKLFVRYKYKLIVSVMVLMALDALLIKGFIDMFTATLNGSFFSFNSSSVVYCRVLQKEVSLL
ncbi:hypothetical protein ACT7DE_20565 [Bacillus paranthracis]